MALPQNGAARRDRGVVNLVAGEIEARERAVGERALAERDRSRAVDLVLGEVEHAQPRVGRQCASERGSALRGD
eukprot:473446-Prymnesium_polylepis.1